MARWVVTGANRGIGLEMARQLAARGESVVATARDPDGAEDLRRLDVRVLPLDVAEPDTVRELTAHLGADPVDVLVNNAGAGGGDAPFEQLDWVRVERLFRVNAVGAMRVTQALLPALERAGTRKVVSVTSRMGSIADNGSGGWYAYRASKAALNMLNKSLSLELATRGFTCVVVHPGWVRTDMGGPQAPLTPEESVRGLLRVIDGLKASDSGRFLDHEGAEIPW